MSGTSLGTDSALRTLPVTPPPRVLPLALIALGTAVVTGMTCLYSLASLHEMLDNPSVVVTCVVIAVGAATWLPVVPALGGLRAARTRTRLIGADDVVAARHVAALGRESAATALGYAVTALILAALVALVTANDGAISTTFLRGEFIEQAWNDVAKAFWVNIRVAVGAEILVLVVGLVVAVMRMLPGRAGRPLRLLAIAYVDTFRAIPGIIVIFLVGFGLSLAKVPVIEDFPPISLAILALTLTYGAYVAEVYRAGLESIHPSQWAAARSLGLSYPMTLRTVIIPQAVRRIVPPLLNDFIGLQKDTALIGIMGVIDAFSQARLISSSVFNLSPVMVVAAVFVLATIPQARYVDHLIAKDQKRQRSGGGR